MAKLDLPEICAALTAARKKINEIQISAMSVRNDHPVPNAGRVRQLSGEVLDDLLTLQLALDAARKEAGL